MERENPCRRCEERRAGCHAECSKYLEWSEWTSRKKAEYKEKNTNVKADSVLFKGIARQKKRRRNLK